MERKYLKDKRVVYANSSEESKMRSNDYSVTFSCVGANVSTDYLLSSILIALDIEKEFHQWIDNSDVIDDQNFMSPRPTDTMFGMEVLERCTISRENGNSAIKTTLGEMRKLMNKIN